MQEVEEVVEMATTQGNNNIIVTIIVLLIAIVFVAEHIMKFREIFGIRTKWDDHEQQQTKEILELKQEVVKIKQEVEDIKSTNKHDTNKRIEFEECVTKSLNTIKNDMLDEKIQRMRSEILDFAAGLKIKDYNEESFSHIFDVYSRYNKVIRENNMTNGYVDLNMDKIRNDYALRHNNTQYVEE